jgi:hypothetical protein
VRAQIDKFLMPVNDSFIGNPHHGIVISCPRAGSRGLRQGQPSYGRRAMIYQVEAGRTHSTHGRSAERMRFISLGLSMIFPAALRAALFVVAFLHFPAPGNAQQGPFAGLSGAWSGGGYLTLASGQRERLRCRANYRVDENGMRLQQSLRCASDSYRFDVNSNIASESRALSGSWSETSRNVSGSVSGRVNGSQIQARIDGVGFSANLVVNTRGGRQSVAIQSPGHEVTEVSVTLTKTA